MTSFYFIIHNFGILLRRHILTIFVSICDPAYVMINDVMMHDVTNVNIMWAMVMFIFMFMLESSWHLALDVWLVVYVWAMGKYYYLQNNLLFPVPYVS